MDDRKVVAISRQELYDRVWTAPLTVLCSDFGVSTTELARVCDEHDIPRPSSGYWAKKQHGKAAPPTPLPASDESAIHTIEFGPQQPSSGKSPDTFDADIKSLLGKVRALPALTVRAGTNDLHPMVRAVRDQLKRATPDTHHLVSTPPYGDLLVEVAVGKVSVPRAVRFLNALLKAIEKLGGRIEVRPDGGLQRHETVAHLCGETVPFRLRERYRQVPIPPGERDTSSVLSHLFAPRCNFVLTGEFVVDRGRNSFGRAYADDATGNCRVEEKIHEILVALVTEAGNLRGARRARDAEQKRRDDEARLRLEQAEREAAERARVEQLLDDAETWRQAGTLREFIKAVEELASARKANSREGTELATWLKWARQQAEALDPVATTLNRLTNKSAG